MLASTGLETSLEYYNTKYILVYMLAFNTARIVMRSVSEY